MQLKWLLMIFNTNKKYDRIFAIFPKIVNLCNKLHFFLIYQSAIGSSWCHAFFDGVREGAKSFQSVSIVYFDQKGAQYHHRGIRHMLSILITCWKAIAN